MHSRESVQFETMRWLIEQGYVFSRNGFTNNETWGALGLTDKGLAALNSVPDVLSGKEPLGKRLAVAVGKGSFEIIKELIPAIIQQAV